MKLSEKDRSLLERHSEMAKRRSGSGNDYIITLGLEK